MYMNAIFVTDGMWVGSMRVEVSMDAKADLEATSEDTVFLKRNLDGSFTIVSKEEGMKIWADQNLDRLWNEQIGLLHNLAHGEVYHFDA